MHQKMVNLHQKMVNYTWLLIGLGVGILSNFIVNLFYDWIKLLGGWKFILMSALLVVLFLMVTYMLVNQLKEYRARIDFAHNSKKMWIKAKSINVGPAMKAYDNEELKQL